MLSVVLDIICVVKVGVEVEYDMEWTPPSQEELNSSSEGLLQLQR